MDKHRPARPGLRCGRFQWPASPGGGWAEGIRHTYGDTLPHVAERYQPVLCSQRGNQVVDRLAGLCVNVGGQVGIDGGGGWGSVAEIGLDDAQVEPSLQQVGGVGVPQGVNGGGLLHPAFPQGGSKGFLNAAFVHKGVGLFGSVEGVDGWKQPNRVAMGEPVLAQHLQAGFGQGHIAVLAALAVSHMHHLARPIDVFDLQGDAFQQTQSAGIDGRQADAVTHGMHALQDLLDFLPAQNHRQFRTPGRTDKFKRVPFPFECMLEEELDAAQRQSVRTAGNAFDVYQVQEVLTQFLFADQVGGFVIIRRQLAHCLHIGLLRPLGQTAQLQVFDHFLS